MKQALFKIKGMQRDLTESSFNAELAYENYNIRLSSNETTSVLSIQNEKGTKIVPQIENRLNPTYNVIATGKVCGCCTVGDYIVLFVWESDDVQKIIRISFIDGTTMLNLSYPNVVTLFSGNLGIPEDTFLETLVDYENEEVQKVYWTDGVNQPRVINIVASEDVRSYWTSTSFDFVQTLNGDIECTITKNLYGGNFPAGTIQYAFTYSNKNGQETAIFHISPLMYITGDDKGLAADSSSTNSFKIYLNELQSTKYRYLNIYSIIRSSLNGTVDARLVIQKDLQDLDGSVEFTFTDTGVNQTSIDANELFYKGGTTISCQTMAAKDGTLFLGNIKTLNNITADSIAIQKLVDDGTAGISFSYARQSRSTESTSYNNDYYENNFQLNANSNYGIRHFKYLETYRFGFQLQYPTGEWTDPIFIGDYKIEFSQTVDRLYYPTLSLSSTIWRALNEYGFIRIRPLVVFPEDYNRECICQGILCPTVYNASDRIDNSPFAQASWFYRPVYMGTYTEDDKSASGHVPVMNGHNIPLNIYKVPYTIQGDSAESTDSSFIQSSEHKRWEMPVYVCSGYFYNVASTIGGNWLSALEYIYIATYDDSVDWTYSYGFYGDSVFYIDNSIITLNSPEIEYDENFPNLNLSNCNLRIIGVAPLSSYNTEFYVEIDNIQTEDLNEASCMYYAPEFRHPLSSGYTQGNRRGINGKGLGISVWSDYYKYSSFFNIPPWCVSDTCINEYDQTLRTSNNVEDTTVNIVSTNKTSHISYSTETYYLNTDNNDTILDIQNSNIADIKLFNSDEITGVVFNEADAETTINPIYYGNIDKIVTFSPYTHYQNPTTQQYMWSYFVPFIRKSTTSLRSSRGITRSTCEQLFTTESYIDGALGMLQSFDEYLMPLTYKSSPHVMIALNSSNSRQMTIPTYATSTNLNGVDGWIFRGDSLTLSSAGRMFWEKERSYTGYSYYNFTGMCTDNRDGLADAEGVLLIGELYREVDNKFGNTDRATFATQTWVIAGPDDRFVDGSSCSIRYLYGDTFYQRYDSLKTYELNEDDLNSVYEVASVMIETRQNLQGRYDSKLGFCKFFNITSSNFTNINTAYNQSNNYFSQNVVDTVNVIDKFTNTITWTSTKSAGINIDPWTQVTLASTLDLKGSNGVLRKLQEFNNEILAFQDSAISQVLFNTRTQLTTTEGVPIEIANSEKVDGVRYFTNTLGCKNKFSIQRTPNGLYFVDSINKDIYRFTGEFKNISDELGMRSWVNSIDTEELFTLYDADIKDVLFVTDSQCLAYSERLHQFTSFYQYGGINNLVNLNNSSYTFSNIADNSSDSLYMWEYRQGDQFFGVDSTGAYTTLLVSQNPTTDKTFTNIEFRGLGLNNNNEEVCPFTNIDVWNDYQNGADILEDKPMFPANLKQKFRIWRAHIPRENDNILNRIRSPWAYVKLSSLIQEDEGTPRDIKVQDIVVGYIE